MGGRVDGRIACYFLSLVKLKTLSPVSMFDMDDRIMFLYRHVCITCYLDARRSLVAGKGAVSRQTMAGGKTLVLCMIC